MHLLLTLACGMIVGLSLGIIGGGGSILAVPLLIHVVGVSNPHVAIGTSVLAVGVSALVNLAGHWRRDNVRWRCAAVFTAAGLLGTISGAQLGLRMDGQKLLLMFAIIMVAVALAMLRPRASGGKVPVRLTEAVAARLLGIGLVAGFVSGFFGIGGGFLIVPGLILATGMPILDAIGSSLVAVTVFGFTTATSYAMSGVVEWHVALELIAGGMAGGAIGVRLATKLGTRRRVLEKVFAGVVLALAATVAVRAIGAQQGELSL